MRRWFFFAWCVTCISGAHAMTAQASLEHHDLNQVRERVKLELTQYLIGIYGEEKTRQDIAITISNLDSRLTLPKCSSELITQITETAYGQRSMPVRISCKEGARWSIFVPTSIDIYEDVVVSTRRLGKGEHLTKEDIILKRTNTSQVGQSYIESVKELIGKEMKRTLKAGVMLRPRDITEPKLVNRGDSVDIRSRTKGIMVSTQGTALSDGRLGQRIKIRNTRSTRVVDALVVGPGVTEVSHW